MSEPDNPKPQARTSSIPYFHTDRLIVQGDGVGWSGSETGAAAREGTPVPRNAAPMVDSWNSINWPLTKRSTSDDLPTWRKRNQRPCSAAGRGEGEKSQLTCTLSQEYQLEL